MPTMEQIVLGALALTSTGLLAMLLFVIKRAIKSFDDNTRITNQRFEAVQRNQSQMLNAIGKLQEQLKTLFERSIENRTRIVRLEDHGLTRR